MINSINSVFVLGSTSHIARSICIELAKQGCKKFYLVSRDLEKNKDLVNILRQYKVEVLTEENDLLLNTSIQKPFLPVLEKFDLYLIVAGCLGDAKKARSDTSEALRIATANYVGILPWLNSIATNERINTAGRLWVFSSVAADRGRPSNYHYGAAKSALTTYCQGLLSRCYKKPFKIRVIKAGFMSTPMTIGRAPRSLCVSPNKVAKLLLRKPNKRGIEYLPWWWEIVMFLIRLLPDAIASRL